MPRGKGTYGSKVGRPPKKKNYEEERQILMPFSKYSSKQKKIARVAAPRNKITGADFKAIKRKKKK